MEQVLDAEIILYSPNVEHLMFSIRVIIQSLRGDRFQWAMTSDRLSVFSDEQVELCLAASGLFCSLVLNRRKWKRWALLCYRSTHASF